MNEFRYLFFKRGETLPPTQPRGIDYIVAANGLFLRVANADAEIVRNEATTRIAGLTRLEPCVRLPGEPRKVFGSRKPIVDLSAVRHLTTQKPLPNPQDAGYDYILGGSGIFKRAHGYLCSCLLPVVSTRVIGLPDVVSYIRLQTRRIPEQFLHIVLQDARSEAWDAPEEAMYHVVYADGRFKLLKPRQDHTDGRVSYEGGSDPSILCDLHSHHELSAYFSPTDDRDEEGFRFYAVIGKIFSKPEIAVRIGAYGDRWSVPATTLFAGLGPFEDTFEAGSMRTAKRASLRCKPDYTAGEYP